MTSSVVREEQDEAVATFRALMFSRGETDPYPLYARLRSTTPVLHSPLPNLLGGVVLSRYAECSAALRSRALVPFSGEHLDSFYPNWRERTASRLLYRSLVFQHHHQHSDVRRLLTPHFSRTRTSALRDVVHNVAESMIDGLAERTDPGEVVDLVEELTLPFPLAVISTVFGLDPDSTRRFGQDGRTLSCFLEPMQTSGLRKRIDRAADEFVDFFDGVVQQRRDEPGDDLVSCLVRAADSGDVDESELFGNLLFLFTAGYDSSTSFLGMAIRTLLQHPEQAALLRQRPDLASGAVEELLRYNPPVHATTRVATTQSRVGEADIPAGSLVWILLASANRDPMGGDAPEVLDLSREPGQHLSFAVGPHACLGARLARMESEVLLPLLLRRFPRMRPAGPVRHRLPGMLLRGIDRLPVVLDS